MKILLTGGSGQLGTAMKPHLAQFGEVVAPSRTQLDLQEPHSIRAVVEAVRPDLIVNAGAYTAVDDAERNADLAHAVNAEAVAAIGEAARRQGAAVIHYSTDYVFDGCKSAPYCEDDPPMPLNVYGSSKLKGEQLLAASGCAWLVLRITWLYSAAHANFLVTMLRLGRERESVSVVGDQHGAPTSAAVVAQATSRILAKAAGNLRAYLDENGGVVHLACSGETTWFGFAETIFAEARRRGIPLALRELRRISTAEFPRPARRPANSRFSLALLSSRFGVATPHWRDALLPELDAVAARLRA